MSSRKPPCRFFQQGTCRKGNRCQFPHVYENNNNNGSGNGGNVGFGSNNGVNLLKKEVERFADSKSLESRDKELKDALNCVPEIEIAIVTSSMGFGYPATENLISGRDYSFEESRWDYYQAQQQNAIPQYEQQLNVRAEDMKMCIEELSRDSMKAARYSQVAAAEKLKDPNQTVKPFLSRPLDLTGANLQQGGGAFGTQSTTPFGSANATSNPFGAQQSSASPFGSLGASNTGGAFGSQSLGGGTSSAFGTSGFGASNTTSAFGSAPLGGSNNITSAFGSSGFGSSGSSTSPFGKSTFGSTSAATTISPFGGAANSTTTPAFGSSSLGASNTTSAFGTSGFGASGFGANSTTSGTSSAFGASGFGASAASSSPFGALGSTSTATPFGQASTSTSPFGQASTTTNPSPFGQTGTTSAFGSSGFGQSSTTAFGSSAFGQQASTSSPFGQNGTTSTSSPFSTGFGSAFGGVTNNNANKPSGNFQPMMKQSGVEPDRVSADELSDYVKKEFEADHFTLGLVPEIEPPLVYC